jgi:nucleoid-associated protein YgaU
MGWIGDQVAALRGADFPAAVLALVTLVTLGLAAWALLVVVLASVPSLRGFAVALTPRILRGVVLAGVAGALTVPVAHAEDRGVDGLRLPDRPLVAASELQRVQHTVLVRRGDTLWSIAQAHFGSHAELATTARAVEQWHDTNHDVIGPDPDLIHPGQRLDPPSKDRS